MVCLLRIAFPSTSGRLLKGSTGGSPAACRDHQRTRGYRVGGAGQTVSRTALGVPPPLTFSSNTVIQHRPPTPLHPQASLPSCPQAKSLALP